MREDGAVAPRWPYLDHSGPIALAHRGGDAYPENTVRAFEHAMSLGYRYVETDVQVTADGTVVVFHDDTLDRVTDGTGTVAALPARMVARARVAGTDPIPLLEDVLGALPSLRLNIDVKVDAAVEPVLAVLRRTRAHARVCLGAFSDRRIRRLRAGLPPGTATALAPREVAALKLAAAAPGPLARFPAALLPRDAPCVQVPERHGRIRVIDAAFVAAAHAHGRQVHVWTVNDRAAMERLLDLGVDGLVSDATELLATVLAERAGRGAS
jgi:glycerophosphoryl diester phosphodiesterase